MIILSIIVGDYTSTLNTSNGQKSEPSQPCTRWHKNWVIDEQHHNMILNNKWNPTTPQTMTIGKIKVQRLTGNGTGCSLCNTCTKCLLVDLSGAGQLYKINMLLPAKGATVLPRHFLFCGGFGGCCKGCSFWIFFNSVHCQKRTSISTLSH